MTFLRNQKTRNLLLQALFVLVVLVVVLGGWRNAQAVMQAQNMVSGFGFLRKSAGWDMAFSLIPLTAMDPYWRFFLAGILNTLFLGTMGLMLATLIGAMVGIARTSGNEMLMLLGRIHVDFFRNIPLILQVFFWYAVVTHLPAPRAALVAGPMTLSNRGIYVPALNLGGSRVLAIAVVILATLVVALIFGTRRARGPRRGKVLAVLAGGAVLAVALVLLGRAPGAPLVDLPRMAGLTIRGGLRVSPEFTALLVAIGTYGGAYIGEIVRGGFQSVGRGQLEAARSLGLRPWHVFARVRFPLALRAMLPILANQYVWLIKATTMGIAIGFSDFFMVVAVTINQSGQTLEAIALLMAGLLAINLTLAAIFNRINRAIALKGNQLRG